MQPRSAKSLTHWFKWERRCWLWGLPPERLKISHHDLEYSMHRLVSWMSNIYLEVNLNIAHSHIDFQCVTIALSSTTSAHYYVTVKSNNRVFRETANLWYTPVLVFVIIPLSLVKPSTTSFPNCLDFETKFHTVNNRVCVRRIELQLLIPERVT